MIDENTTLPALPKLDEIAKAAQYVSDCATSLRKNGDKIVGDLEQIEQAILMEANTIKQEAESRSAALFERAQQVRKMIEFHVGFDAAELPALEVVSKAA